MHRDFRPNGFALVSALAFLLVITLLGVSLFLGVNLQEKAAGNSLQKTRALALANSATTAAERWLASRLSRPPPKSCSGANSASFRVCIAPPSTPDRPNTWRTTGATPIGFAKLDLGTGGGVDTYYRAPGVWITFLGQATMAPGDLYLINAYAWGGNERSLVVTEAVFYVGGSAYGSTPARNLGQ